MRHEISGSGVALLVVPTSVLRTYIPIDVQTRKHASEFRLQLHWDMDKEKIVAMHH